MRAGIYCVFHCITSYPVNQLHEEGTLLKFIFLFRKQQAKKIKMEVNRNMYTQGNKNKENIPGLQDIAVEWETGTVKGFRSEAEAERYINHVCKKVAPGMDFSISSYLQK